MATVIDIKREAALPSLEQILAVQDIPAERMSDRRTARLAAGARATFERLAQPSGIMDEVRTDEFRHIYAGEGLNDSETVLDDLYPVAAHLSLFAVTVGEAVSREITGLFAKDDYAAAVMLDAAASVGAEMAAESVAVQYEAQLMSKEMIGAWQAVLPFSPGYCGWHVSGQKRLFERLKPEVIGVTLGESCLMQPLKSVSGVLVAAGVADFDIEDSYVFCSDCADHTCRDRYQRLTERQTTRLSGD
jgi:hypothetical protein